MYHIGIDLGTSAVKMILCDDGGNLLKTVSKTYPLMIDGLCAEQNPDDWWSAVKEGLAELTDGFEKEKISSLGAGGQMHGLVILDSEDRVIRPAILWNDGRTTAEVEYLNETVGTDYLKEKTGNIAFAGFTAPKILWLRKHEPENFKKISKIMLPKDYITYKLTGEFVTDVSDASGTLLFDCKNRCWSSDMCSVCEVSLSQLPRVFESSEAVGVVKQSIADEFGFGNNVVVVAGAGDNAAAAIGMGICDDTACNISLGTSGTLFVCSDKFADNADPALHSFCHANGKWHLMGCMLSAASCNKWFCEEILKTADYSALQSAIPASLPGSNNVFFLPYLTGERCPHNDPLTRGAFIGLSADTGREQIVLAVLEGVAFGIRDCFELVKKAGVKVTASNICGGGAKSPLWRQIMADVLNIELAVPVAEEGPAYGGALLSMVGDNTLKDISQCRDFSGVREIVKPRAHVSAAYDEKYAQYVQLYPALKEIYKRG